MTTSGITIQNPLLATTTFYKVLTADQIINGTMQCVVRDSAANTVTPTVPVELYAFNTGPTFPGGGGNDGRLEP